MCGWDKLNKKAETSRALSFAIERESERLLIRDRYRPVITRTRANSETRRGASGAPACDFDGSKVD